MQNEHRSPLAQRAPLLDRGLYEARFVGPAHERVLLVVRGNHSLLVPPVTVAWGASWLDVELALLAQLDAEDPPLPPTPRFKLL